MRILILGTRAGLPDPEVNQSAIVLTVAGRHYLFDCGYGAMRQLMRENVHPGRVDHVFLSHLHYDHIADFPVFMIGSWMMGRKNAPVVVGPPDTRHFVDSLLVDGAFRKDIEARAQYPQRQANFDVLKPDVRECEPGLVFEDDLVRVSACYVEHIPREISPCFGLRMDTADGRSVVFSGDTAPCDRLIELARGADLLIHECTFPEVAIRFREKAGIGTWAHTSPTDLGRIASAAGVEELVATHFCAHQAPNQVMREIWSSHMPIDHMGTGVVDDMVADIRANWKGPLRMAHDGMRIDL